MTASEQVKEWVPKKTVVDNCPICGRAGRRVTDELTQCTACMAVYVDSKASVEKKQDSTDIAKDENSTDSRGEKNTSSYSSSSGKKRSR